MLYLKLNELCKVFAKRTSPAICDDLLAVVQEGGHGAFVQRPGPVGAWLEVLVDRRPDQQPATHNVTHWQGLNKKERGKGGACGGARSHHAPANPCPSQSNAAASATLHLITA